MKISVFLFSLLFVVQSFGQLRVGDWGELYSQNDVRQIVATPTGWIWNFGYGIGQSWNDGTVETWTKAKGLSETLVATVAYTASKSEICVVYQNGQVDFVGERKIMHLNDIFEKRGNTATYYKAVSCGDFVLLATSFGVVKIDATKHEITETYFVGVAGSEASVTDIAYDANAALIYLATSRGVLRAKNDGRNLMDFVNWELIDTRDPLFLTASNNAWLACFAQSPQEIHLFNSFGESVSVSTENYSGLGADGNAFFAFTAHEAYRYATDLSNHTQLNTGNKAITSLCLSSGTLAYGVAGQGLFLDGKAWASNAIGNNSPSVIAAGNASVFMAGTATDASLFVSAGPLDGLVLSANTTTALPVGAVYAGGNFWMLDAANNIWKLNNDKSFSKQTLPACAAICAAPNETLWLVSSPSSGKVYAKAVDSEWLEFTLGSLGTQAITSLMADDQQHLWMVQSGQVRAIDANSKLSKTFGAIDNEGNSIGNTVSCILADRDGGIWGGCENGVFILSNSYSIFSNTTTPVSYRPITQSGGDAAYLLSKKQITCMVADDANRKWIGTQNTGLFLVSPQGDLILANFTRSNSILPSDKIEKLAYDKRSGLLIVQTSAGVVTYKDVAANTGTDMESAHIFPNPVRPNYDGLITATGLSQDALVKITDVAGHLVKQGTALGGQFAWDGRTHDGTHVASGVYLFFCISPDGLSKKVLKVLIVR
ncbi:MAG: hypothetical protein RIS47_1514 [Bacteroidota bacterium]|jgi:hypothetical protein